jgi:PKD repeat protein
MRVSLWTIVGALLALSAVSACTRGEEKPVTAGSTPVASPGVAAAAPATAETEGDDILMVWAEADPDEGEPPLTVQLTADISGGVGERTVKWDFGDGSPPSNEVNPKHTYEKPGTYRASVEVADSSGDSDSDYVDIEVGTE